MRGTSDGNLRLFFRACVCVCVFVYVCVFLLAAGLVVAVAATRAAEGAPVCLHFCVKARHNPSPSRRPFETAPRGDMLEGIPWRTFWRVGGGVHTIACKLHNMRLGPGREQNETHAMMFVLWHALRPALVHEPNRTGLGPELPRALRAGLCGDLPVSKLCLVLT